MGTHGIRRRFGTRKLKRVTNRIKEGFESKRFDVLASDAATLAAVAATEDAATLFLAAAEAFKIAKEKDWREEPDQVVTEAYRNARDVRRFRISKQRAVDVKDSLRSTLDEFKRSRRGSS